MVNIALIISCVVSTLCLTPKNVYADKLYSLKGDYSYSNFLPSVIFSKSASGNVDEVNVSMEELLSYDKSGIYGQLQSSAPDPDKKNAVGRQTTSYIKTLYGYDYLVPVPNVDDNVLNSLVRIILGKKASVGDTFQGGILSIAALGASLFDSSISFIEWLGKSVAAFNIPTLLGYSASVVTDGAINDVTLNPENWIANLFKSMFDSIGFNNVALDTIRSVFGLTVVILLALAVMSVVIGHKRNHKAVVRAKNWGFRLFIMCLTPCLAFFLTDIANSVTEGANGVVENLSRTVSSNYIVDTLNWAATLNLSLSPISHSSMSTSGNVDKTFQPTDHGIELLNTEINNRSMAAWPSYSDDDKSDKNDSKDKSGKGLLSALVNGQTASVQDYFDKLTSAAEGSSTISAQYNQLGKNTRVSRTGKSKEETGFTPMFIYKVDKATDVDKTKSKVTPTSTGSFTINSDYGKIKIDFVESWAMRFKKVVWNDPTSYIYGSLPSGSADETSTNAANFYGKADNDETYNPQTGTAIANESGDKLTHPSASGKSDSDSDDDPILKPDVMSENSLMIALWNKYAGIEDTSSVTSLSTQTVAFLLQSTFDNDTLSYKGYQTTPSSQGSSKNTGINGTKFLRYVMPNTGDADLSMKMGGLSVTWITAGVVAIIAAFTVLTVPILSTIFKSMSGFIRAVLTGDVFALLEYVVYYLAMRLAFVTTVFGISGGFIAVSLASSIFGHVGVSNFDVGFVGEIPVIGSWIQGGANIIQGVCNIIIGLIFAAMANWPFFELAADKPNKKSKKLSIIQLCVCAPFLIAQSVTSDFDRYRQAVYGSSGAGKNVMRSLGGKLKPLDQKKFVGDIAKGAAVKAVQLGSAVATGGTGSAAMAAATAGAKKAGLNAASSKLLGTVAGGAGKLANKRPGLPPVDGPVTGLALRSAGNAGDDGDAGKSAAKGKTDAVVNHFDTSKLTATDKRALQYARACFGDKMQDGLLAREKDGHLLFNAAAIAQVPGTIIRRSSKDGKMYAYLKDGTVVRVDPKSLHKFTSDVHVTNPGDVGKAAGKAAAQGSAAAVNSEGRQSSRAKDGSMTDAASATKRAAEANAMAAEATADTAKAVHKKYGPVDSQSVENKKVKATSVRVGNTAYIENDAINGVHSKSVAHINRAHDAFSSVNVADDEKSGRRIISHQHVSADTGAMTQSGVSYLSHDAAQKKIDELIDAFKHDSHSKSKSSHKSSSGSRSDKAAADRMAEAAEKIAASQDKLQRSIDINNETLVDTVRQSSKKSARRVSRDVTTALDDLLHKDNS